MSTLKVRVNPDSPSERAVFVSEGLPYPWIASKGDCNYNWMNDARVADWAEFTLEVPEPERAFKPGDVVTVDGVLYVRSGKSWYGYETDTYGGGDSWVRKLTYHYVGNVRDLRK